MEENTQSESAGRNPVDNTPENSATDFSKNRFLVLRNLVNNPALAFLSEYATKAAEFGKTNLNDSQVPNTPSQYGDAIMESLMEGLLPRFETVTGVKLYPTYSYFRVYKRGDVLNRHTDRQACEISVTLSLGYSGIADGNAAVKNAWPIWIEQAGIAQSFALEPGDALVYKGVETPHWRDRFLGERAAQVFMHYVDQDGPFKDWKLDKRESLASTAITRQIMSGLGISSANT
jgi:hypothetical protein